MNLGKKYIKAAPAARWPGGDVFTAEGPGGESYFIYEASRAEAGAAPFLSHPSLPVYIETIPGPAGTDKKYLVYEHFEGRSVAAIKAGGGTFTEIEALKIGYETARALQYLHGLSPRAAHGAVSEEAVFRTTGRVLLCGRGTGADTASDLKGLAGLMRDLEAGHRDGRFSDAYRKMAEALDAPGLEAAQAVRLIESTGARKPFETAAPLPKAGPTGRKLPLYAWPAALIMLLIVFSAAFQFRFEVWPQLRARLEISRATELAQDFPCTLVPAHDAQPRLEENLVFNPGLEGNCGWRAYGGFKRSMIRRGDSHGGIYYFHVEGPEDGIYQDVDVSMFSHRIASGACRVRFSGYLKAGGIGRDGEPYLYGYAMRSENDYTYLSGFSPVSFKIWSEASHDWPLPAGAKKVRIFLHSSSYKGTIFSKKAYFDDISVKVSCPPAARPGLSAPSAVSGRRQSEDSPL